MKRPQTGARAWAWLPRRADKSEPVEVVYVDGPGAARWVAADAPAAAFERTEVGIAAVSVADFARDSEVIAHPDRERALANPPAWARPR